MPTEFPTKRPAFKCDLCQKMRINAYAQPTETGGLRCLKCGTPDETAILDRVTGIFPEGYVSASPKSAEPKRMTPKAPKLTGQSILDQL